MKKVALYLRISTNEQTTENQRRELMDRAERSGWEVVKVYEDQGVSGSKGRDERPQFDQMLKDATRKEFDLVMAWSVDRLGRSLLNLIEFLQELHSLKIDLYLHQQGIDTTTPAGKAMFSMLGVFAEFERSMIQERVKSGLERAKANGVKLGRRPVSDDKREAVLAARQEGLSVRKIAEHVGLSVGKVHGIVKEVPSQH